jgi:antitoxin FitA
MPRAITIRDVPDDVVDELSVRAARSGRSLQEYLRGHLVDVVTRPDLDVWLDRATASRHTLGDGLTSDEILAARDADRR